MTISLQDFQSHLVGIPLTSVAVSLMRSGFLSTSAIRSVLRFCFYLERKIL